MELEEALETIELCSRGKSLQNSRTDHKYAQIMRSIYKNTAMVIQINVFTRDSPVNRGIR